MADEKKYMPMLGVMSQIKYTKDLLAKQPDFNDVDAVLSCVSKMGSIDSLQYRDFDYMIDSKEPIKIQDGIEFQLLDVICDKDGRRTQIVYRIWSETKTMQELKNWVRKCRQDYEMLKNDKLGDITYYFDQTTASDMKFQGALSFTREKFGTTRSFKNVFFDDKSRVVKRVERFIKEPAWYAKRGIPHTLGFMFHGVPGCGKTSMIKAIANETKRHIVNVKFSEIKTATQLKNLFYNSVLQVVNPETMNVDKCIVPIHQRLYVIEDIDCMTDLIKRRDIAPAPNANLEAKIAKLEHKVAAATRPVVTKKVVLQATGDDDVDNYFAEAIKSERQDMLKEKEEDENKDKITLDTLLNILDGTLEIPNRMFCITTNHIDVIDPALIRPGRVDMIIEFKRASHVVMQQMFESFYDSKFDPASFAAIPEYTISPAEINQVMFNHDDPLGAIADLKAFRRPSHQKAGATASRDAGD